MGLDGKENLTVNENNLYRSKCIAYRKIVILYENNFFLGFFFFPF